MHDHKYHKKKSYLLICFLYMNRRKKHYITLFNFVNNGNNIKKSVTTYRSNHKKKSLFSTEKYHKKKSDFISHPIQKGKSLGNLDFVFGGIIKKNTIFLTKTSAKKAGPYKTGQNGSKTFHCFEKYHQKKTPYHLYTVKVPSRNYLA